MKESDAIDESGVENVGRGVVYVCGRTVCDECVRGEGEEGESVVCSRDNGGEV